MKSSLMRDRTLAASVIVLGIGMTVAPTALADNSGTDGSAGPVVVTPVDPSDKAQAPAVQACGEFAQILDDSSNYYGDFADSFEGSDYNDPAVASSSAVGRTALRQAAAAALTAAQTPGLDPSIADPMRMWSLGATKLLVEMGLRIPGQTLNDAATEMNNDAVVVQHACAAAGTHA
ncbi:MAG: hypothetical protein NVSMB60_28540 [Mycobacterium sp.]